MTGLISQECFRFGTFRLYPMKRALMLREESVSVGGRAFDILLYLVARAGTVVSVGELMRQVWPNITVEENNLRVQIGMLRKILARCDEAGRAIETVPLRGYCFVLPVTHDTPCAPLAPEQPAGPPRLPTPLSPIVGREATVGQIRAAFASRRLVTITGPGGIGKTTVAIETVNRHHADLAQLFAFVDLSGATDAAEAASAIGLALGIAMPAGDPKSLQEAIGAQSSLLVLDTCEHLVEEIAALAEFLLARCPNLHLLVTSREVLRAAGEWILRLPSLRFPEKDEAVDRDNLGQFTAITLFIDRIRSTLRYDIDDRDLPVLAEICRRLDGIPLALEFAAARVADLGLRKIAAHLDDRFKILTRGRRAALPRHRTLSAAIDWSYGLLSSDEQLMLDRMAQAGGTFTVESAISAGAEAGCAQPRDALWGLYEKSLLSIEMRRDTPVYRLLDTTRAYMTGPSRPDMRG